MSQINSQFPFPRRGVKPPLATVIAHRGVEDIHEDDGGDGQGVRAECYREKARVAPLRLVLLVSDKGQRSITRNQRSKFTNGSVPKNIFKKCMHPLIQCFPRGHHGQNRNMK